MGRPEILKISFEFSTKLGIRELPKVDQHHESNIDGLYVVGDLADAPIIKVALKQGYEVAQRVWSELGAPNQNDDLLDVAIIGAGPAGIGAALALQETNAKFGILERERPFQTIQNFPKAKLIFSEPREIENIGNFWFEDAKKEDLVDKWDQALEDKKLEVQQPEEVLDIEKQDGVFVIKTKVGAGGLMHNPIGVATPEEGAKNTYRARRVILAIGRRGSVNKLNCPGEELEKVNYALRDPQDHVGQKLCIFGGGDSAVEAACDCADAGADVTISYRQDGFHRAKLGNRERIEKMIDAGTIRAEYETTPVEVTEKAVSLKRKDGSQVEIPNDQVLVFFGTKLPKSFLSRVGIRMAGAMDIKRVLWITTFALITYFFYVLKHKKDYFPFGPSHPLGFLPEALKVDLGFRTVDAGFWGTVIYSLMILVFGIIAYRKYPSKTQKVRYISLIVFQMLFLFGIPELIAPLIIDRPWKMYALTVPWPLSIWSLIDAPSWAGGNTTTAVLWIAAGAFAAFVAIPLYVRYQGERFCSYMCGCGGLAETLGDQWRHLAPRGSGSYKSEWFGRAILILAVPVTLLILNDAWQFFAAGALYDTKLFAEKWYGLMVDFWLASVLGVAFYPYLGNRVWCRFFCPLRAWMEILSRKFSKIAISANDKCIGCGECTRYCQMGIDVQKFAQRRETFDNSNSSCIQCGICIQVCPMDVLYMDERTGAPSPGGAMGPAGHKV